MSIIDFVCVGVLLWAAWKGYHQGLWTGLASLVGLVVGIWMALFFAESLQNWFGWQSSSLAMGVLSFVCILILSVFLIRLSVRLIRAVLHLTPFGWIDNLLGAVFSLLVWGGLVSLCIWALQDVIYLGDSLAAGLLQQTGDWIAASLGSTRLHIKVLLQLIVSTASVCI